MNRQLCLALIAMWVLFFENTSRHTPAAEPTEQQTQVESEFTSVEVARAVEKKLRALADKVAPAVVKLSETGAMNSAMMEVESSFILRA